MKKASVSKEMLNEIKNAIAVLEDGGLILYPTDTVWGIGCDATNENAVQRVYALKKREDSKALICLVGNEAMLEKHVEKVPEVAFDLIEYSEKPMTIIYDNPKGVAKNLIAVDNTLGIRIATDKFCQYLITRFRKPLVSTSANISGAPTPKNYGEIGKSILKGVDYAVALHRDKNNGSPSSIIKLGNDASVKIIRP